jgi:hypothetical protein
LQDIPNIDDIKLIYIKIDFLRQNTQCEAKAKNKMEPECFKYNDKNVYDLDSLVQYDQA